MNHICIGRFDNDPEAQDCIRSEDGSWQLVIDKDGYPHLYVRAKLAQEKPDDPTEGLVNIDDMLAEGLNSIRDIMESSFGGRLSPEEETAAHAEFLERKAAHGIPCPR